MTDGPKSCPICGYYLTITTQFAGYRCVDAGHWQAAGLITPYDYYLMAKIMARASVELTLRTMNQTATNTLAYGQNEKNGNLLRCASGMFDIVESPLTDWKSNVNIVEIHRLDWFI